MRWLFSLSDLLNCCTATWEGKGQGCALEKSLNKQWGCPREKEAQAEVHVLLSRQACFTVVWKMVVFSWRPRLFFWLFVFYPVSINTHLHKYVRETQKIRWLFFCKPSRMQEVTERCSLQSGPTALSEWAALRSPVHFKPIVWNSGFHHDNHRPDEICWPKSKSLHD